MKLIPEEKTIMERMAPGVYCQEGFLGHDTRRLCEIIDTDHATLEHLGVTREQIAAGMESILDKVVGRFGAPVKLDDTTTAIYHEAMGEIPSPFGDGIYPKGEIELTGHQWEKIHFTPLSVHLIRTHGFFQGRGSRYRIEPDVMARLLGLVK